VQGISARVFAHSINIRKSVFCRLKRLERLELDSTAEFIEASDSVHGSFEQGTNLIEGDDLKEGVASGGFVEDEQILSVTHFDDFVFFLEMISG
jgi:hypothetical protein